MSEIERRATQASFSNKERHVLNFVLKHKQEICFLTSNEIAQRIGASPSAVVRFAKRLGYDSFSAFKKALQAEAAPQTLGTAKDIIPYEKIKSCEPVPDLELLAAMRQNTVDNIQRDATPQQYQRLIDASELLTEASRVFVTGFRACSGFASSLSVMLSCIRPGVLAVGGQQPLIDCLVDLDNRDVMVAISFHRYSSDTIFAVNMAADAGCRVIAMTDSYASPIARKADVVIINSIENMSFYNSYASFVTNMEAMVMLTSKRNKDMNENRLMRMEAYLEQTGQY